MRTNFRVVGLKAGGWRVGVQESKGGNQTSEGSLNLTSLRCGERKCDSTPYTTVEVNLYQYPVSVCDPWLGLHSKWEISISHPSFNSMALRAVSPLVHLFASESLSPLLPLPFSSWPLSPNHAFSLWLTV